jgi:hypothetical protein
MARTQRPARSRPLSHLTRDSTLGAVIAVYLGAIAAHGDRRELRSALSHVAAELGTIPVRHIRSWHVEALLEKLSDAGLNPRRQAAVVDALHAVFSFAMARGLIADDPTPRRAARSREPALRWDDVRGRSREVPRRPRELPRRSQGASATPTLTMLALGARVAFWTTWFIVVGFLVLLIALLFEFG